MNATTSVDVGRRADGRQPGGAADVNNKVLRELPPPVDLRSS